jgi:hypothetical protein
MFAFEAVGGGKIVETDGCIGAKVAVVFFD